MEKNETYTVRITDITSDGEGVGKAGAFPLFVKDACVGDLIECRVMKVKKTYGYARLLQVLEPSRDRTEPRCRKARACGGCQLQHMDYSAQLAYKTDKVRQNLKRIGGIETQAENENGSLPVLYPCIGMADPWRYRNKAQIPFGYDKNGELTAGFYAGHTHDIIDMEDCLLAPEETAEAVRVMKEFMRVNGVRAYEEKTGKGLVRHLLVRKGFSSGQVMICVIINGEKLPHWERLAEMLEARVPGFSTLCLNVNRTSGNVILGEKTLTLFGPGYIEDDIGDVRFRISPNSFFQVNPVQTEVLYGKALEFAGLTGSETVWDLYCGIGTISLF